MCIKSVAGLELVSNLPNPANGSTKYLLSDQCAFMSPLLLTQEKEGVCTGSYDRTQSLATFVGTIRKVQAKTGQVIPVLRIQFISPVPG